MKKTRVVLICAGMLLFLLIYRLVVFGGMFRSVAHHSPGPCQRITGILGPEDFAIDRERRKLYVSSHDRRHPKIPGAIYEIDLAQPLGSLAARRLQGEYPAGFFPHGMSLLITHSGERLLYVITHPGLIHSSDPLDFGTEHRIDIFAVQQPLLYRGSIRSTELKNPNDLYVRAPDDIYVTRDHGATTPLGKLLEDVAGLPRTAVLHYDGLGFHPAAQGIVSANGVTGIGDRLYVAACLGRAVHEYAIEGPGRLRELRVLQMPTAPDNLEPDAAGHLWTAGHAAPLKLLPHARSADHLAPSQVLRIDLADGQTQEVYADPGSEIAAASVAEYVDGVVFIGAVFDDHVLACPAPDAG